MKQLQAIRGLDNKMKELYKGQSKILAHIDKVKKEIKRLKAETGKTPEDLRVMLEDLVERDILKQKYPNYLIHSFVSFPKDHIALLPYFGLRSSINRVVRFLNKRSIKDSDETRSRLVLIEAHRYACKELLLEIIKRLNPSSKFLVGLHDDKTLRKTIAQELKFQKLPEVFRILNKKRLTDKDLHEGHNAFFS